MDIENTFNTLSRILFKKELGPVNQFEELLNRYVEPIKQTNSMVNGKKVYYAEPYCRDAKFISDEQHEQMKVDPIKPYEMKDIDALLNAVKERFHYSGNKIFGTSQDIEEGESCGNSLHIYKSYQIFNCENIGYSQMMVNSKYSLGCAWGTESNFCMNTLGGFKSERCFESSILSNSSDLYYSYNCKNCIEGILCFNQNSKRHCIGNTVLEKDRYFDLKEKLVQEIYDELKSKKTIPSLVELTSGGVKNE